MRYVAAYLLAALGGNASPSAKDIKTILGSVGIEADDERLNKVLHVLIIGLNMLKIIPAPEFYCNFSAGHWGTQWKRHQWSNEFR